MSSNLGGKSKRPSSTSFGDMSNSEYETPTIATLQEIEEKIISILDIAAEVCEELATMNPSKQSIVPKSQMYILLVREIANKLQHEIEKISDKPAFQNSVYAERKQAEITYMKMQSIQLQLKEISEFLEMKTKQTS